MVTLSHQALRTLTAEQKERLIKLSDDRHKVVVRTAFDLPTGWVSFELTYEGTATTIYGGIDPQGNAST